MFPIDSVYLPSYLITYLNLIELHKLFPLENSKFYERSPQKSTEIHNHLSTSIPDRVQKYPIALPNLQLD